MKIRNTRRRRVLSRRDEEREGSTCNGRKREVTAYTREKLRDAIENEKDLCIEHERKRDEGETRSLTGKRKGDTADFINN